MPRRSVRRAIAHVVTACLLVAGAFVAASVRPAGAVTERAEQVVATGSPITSVIESVVSIKSPLPWSDGPHPPACDWLSYLRFRDANGPADYSNADKIFLAQPGIYEGAGAFDSVARNTIVASAKLGKHVEFWALDRRSNCLEDHLGVQAGLAAGGSTTAIDYYYNHKPVNGKTFPGFIADSQLGWLGNVGIEQTVRDEYAVMTTALPNQAQRRQKFLCGGHSLGGIVTGFFAEWDFDGNAQTTSDAGYNQCGGYFALDTVISTSLSSLSGMPANDGSGTGGIVAIASALGYSLTQAGLFTGVVPRSLQLPVVINPETMNLLAIVGLAADLNPDAPTDLTVKAPSDFNVNTTLQLLFSKDFLTFVSGTPSVRSFNLTNAAVMGGLLDDNSEPLSFLQSSVGFFKGGPVVDKDFPAPGGLSSVPLLGPLANMIFGHDTKAIPSQPSGPLYGWLNYNEVGGPNDPKAMDRNGNPFTVATKEITDIHELARSFAEQPLNFTEDYFPTKLVTDIFEGTAPQISAKAPHLQALAANPTVTIRAEDGLIAATAAPTNAVVAPGYNHLDVVTAAPIQNNGKPETSSTTLANFASGLP